MLLTVIWPLVKSSSSLLSLTNATFDCSVYLGWSLLIMIGFDALHELHSGTTIWGENFQIWIDQRIFDCKSNCDNLDICVSVFFSCFMKPHCTKKDKVFLFRAKTWKNGSKKPMGQHGLVGHNLPPHQISRTQHMPLPTYQLLWPNSTF